MDIKTRKTSVIEIDLSRIETPGASNAAAPASNPRTAAHRSPRSRLLPIRAARPPAGQASKEKPVRPALEAGPREKTETGKTEAKISGSTPAAEPEASAGGAEGKRSGSGGGTEGKHSGSGGGGGNDRPAGNGQGARSALAEYSRSIRALIERNKEYPFAARRMGFQGSLILSFSVNRLGELRSVSLVKTSGNSMLDNAGLRAVRTAGRFPPPPRHAMSGAEEISFRIPITFALTGG